MLVLHRETCGLFLTFRFKYLWTTTSKVDKNFTRYHNLRLLDQSIYFLITLLYLGLTAIFWLIKLIINDRIIYCVRSRRFTLLDTTDRKHSKIDPKRYGKDRNIEFMFVFASCSVSCYQAFKEISWLPLVLSSIFLSYTKR